MDTAQRTCRACHSPIGRQRSGFERPFCSPLCATAAMYEAKANSQALVRATSDGITCLLCDVDLTVMGTHFLRVHGVPKMGLAELQDYLGVPMGFRFASIATREIHRKHMIEMRSDGRCDVAPFSSDRRLAFSAARIAANRGRPSVLQLATTTKAFAEHRDKRSQESRVELNCKGCGKAITRRRGLINKGAMLYCSARCGYEHRPRVPVSEAFLEAGRKSREQRSDAAKEERACVECGGRFIVNKGNQRQTCSDQCMDSKRRVRAFEQLATLNADCTIYEHGGFSGTLPQIAAHFGIPYGSLKARIHRGMTIAEAITTPFKMKTRGVDCAAGDCGQPVIAKGLCSRHYQQKRKQGSRAAARNSM